MAHEKVAVVLGVGPGLGASVAKRFARGGYTVALMARGMDKLTPVEVEIAKADGKAACITADATDPASIAAAFDEVRRTAGDPEVLVYNAGAFERGQVHEVSVETFERAWRANCFGGFLAARQVVPAMLEAGRGTILLTGATASLRGGASFSCLAVGKFGLRALGQSLARELGPRGIHVAHVIVDGQIDTPRMRKMMPDRDPSTMLAPDAMAESYWHLHAQDPTTWTQELDLRPAPEKW